MLKFDIFNYRLNFSLIKINYRKSLNLNWSSKRHKFLVHARDAGTHIDESKQTKGELPQKTKNHTKEAEGKLTPRKSNKMLIVFIAIIVAVFASGSLIGNQIGYGIGYQSGFKEGKKTGNEEGQEIGYEIGYNFGNNHGYNTGYSEGNSAGYQLGFIIGQKAGYTSGFNIGNQTGYLIGFNDCWQSGFQADGYLIRDPTYRELLNFLEADQTDKIPYDEKMFNCIDFSATIKRNAFNVGYNSFFVYINFSSTSHSIVAFNTTDQGIVFIEPQYDKVLKIEIGENYTLLNGFVYDPNLVITRYLIVL